MHLKKKFQLIAFKKDGAVHIYKEKRFQNDYHPAQFWGKSFEYFLTKDISDENVPITDFLKNEYNCIFET